MRKIIIDPQIHDHCRLYKTRLQTFIEAFRMRAIQDQIIPLDGKTILDAGCGHGDILQALWVPNAAFWGAEINHQSVALCTDRFSNKANVNIVETTLEDLPFESDKFDYIICTEVLEHCVDPDVCLTELCRVLAPFGRIIITVPFENACIAARLLLYPFFKPVLGKEYSIVAKTHIAPFDRRRLALLLSRYFQEYSIDSILCGFKYLAICTKKTEQK